MSTQVELYRAKERCRQLESRNMELEKEAQWLRMQLVAARESARRRIAAQDMARSESPRRTEIPDKPGLRWLASQEEERAFGEITPSTRNPALLVDFPSARTPATATSGKSLTARALSFDRAMDRAPVSPAAKVAQQERKLNARALSFERNFSLERKVSLLEEATKEQKQSQSRIHEQRQLRTRALSFESKSTHPPTKQKPKLAARASSFDRKPLSAKENEESEDGTAAVELRVKRKASLLMALPDGYPPGHVDEKAARARAARARAAAVARAARANEVPQDVLRSHGLTSMPTVP